MASLYQRGEMWWAKFRQGGQVVRVSTGHTKKRAAQDWLDIRAGKIVSGEPVPVRLDQITYDELHQDLLTYYQTVKPIRSLVDQTHRMERVLAHFRGWRAGNVTATEIVRYVAKRQAEIIPGTERHPSPGLLNRELTAIKTVLRHAVKNRKIAFVPAITLLKEPQARQGFLEPEDFEAIAKHLDDGPALAARIAFETAWRCKSEVLTLEWARVNLADGCLVLDEQHSKNGKARRAYLTPATTARLREQRARVEALQQHLGRILPDVFVHFGKGPLRGRRLRAFDDAWRTACIRAGYPGTLIHDLRRSGVRQLVRSGVPESVAMRISGHLTAGIFRRYDITSDQDLRDARDRIAGAQFGHSQGPKVVSIAR